MCRFAYKLQAAEILQVLRTVATVTRTIDDRPPYFGCSGFDADGAAFEAVCNNTTLEATACAAPGIASCTLHYKDINVTKLKSGSIVRVCNPDWARHPEQFYTVAYLSGVANLRADFTPDVPGKEAAALVTLVRAATAPLGPALGEFIKYLEFIVQCKEDEGVWVYNSGKIEFEYAMRCSKTINLDGTRSVTEVHMVADVLEEDDPSKINPRMDDFLLYPLLRLQSLERLILTVRRHQIAHQCLGHPAGVYHTVTGHPGNVAAS
jgi:hypothetical protein